MEPRIYHRPPLDPERFDPDAVKVVRHLWRNGFEAYFVGGCVRDLLFDAEPKDFDIATAASPRQVRKLFRNSRLIGRRFRLAHVFFGPKIVEVASFRSMDPAVQGGQDGTPFLVGDARSDATLRDFTVNALFYDPVGDEILDYVKGMDDIEDACLRTIGSPEQRFTEDPVRIVRGIKTAARLDLVIEPETLAAMVRCREGLEACPRRRLLEEILKILNSSAAEWAFELLQDTQTLDHLVPELASAAGHASLEEGATGGLWDHLASLDATPPAHRSVPVQLGSVFLPLLRARLSIDGGGRITDALFLDTFEPFAVAHSLSRRDRVITREIVVAQQQLESGPDPRSATKKLVRKPYFEEALRLLHISLDARGEPDDLIATWRSVREGVPAGTGEPRPRRRRRRKPVPAPDS